MARTWCIIKSGGQLRYLALKGAFVDNQPAGGRFQTSIQISPDAREQLFALAKVMGTSRTDVLEYAVRELARRSIGQEELEAILAEAEPAGVS
jgi:hypothetical protein